MDKENEVITHAEAAASFVRKKVDARNEVTKAISKGWLVRARYCSQCGSRKRIEAHHEDYEFALAVEWLCSRCHHLRHTLRHFKTTKDILAGACHCGCTHCFVGLGQPNEVKRLKR
jgi:hypothetical protein